MKHSISTLTSATFLHYFEAASFNSTDVKVCINAVHGQFKVNDYFDKRGNINKEINFCFYYQKEQIAALRTILCAIPDQGIEIEFSKEQIIIKSLFI